MKISTDFDSGSIDIVTTKDVNNIQLKLRPDNNNSTLQWFHFKLTTQLDTVHQIKIINAGDSTFPAGWQNYRAFASYDQITWFRVPTIYQNKTLIITHEPSGTEINYAYFPPYSYQRQQTLIKETSTNKYSLHQILGHSLDGNSIDLLRIGEDKPYKKKVWIIARQHPGETMAQWFTEGFIKRLTKNDKSLHKIFESVVFYIVPNMNPDGAIRGNHRTNSAGRNLNRCWSEPSLNTCPEIVYVQKAMEQTGVDLFLDMHGDEEIAYNFAMIANKAQQGKQFKNFLTTINSDFQTQYDYNNYQYSCGTSCCSTSICNSMTLATDYVANEFDCLSMIMELSFKDLANKMDDISIWDNKTSIQLGFDLLDPISKLLKVA